MKKGDKYFVRIDRKIREIEIDPKIYKSHLEYLRIVSSTRFFVGGGFNNTNGGMIIFTAKNLEEAKNISEKDPIFQTDLFAYEIFEWEVVISSE